jgi:restriction system protein
LFDAAENLAEEPDSDMASSALQLLGHISNRIDSEADKDKNSHWPKRVDFGCADVRELVARTGPSRFSELHPGDFEFVIADLFRNVQYSVEQTSYVGDFGADLIASKNEDRIAVQVKRYAESTPVGVGHVNQVIGARQYYGCNKGLVVTTSRFTSAARSLANKTNIVLWDWPILIKQMNGVYKLTLAEKSQ